MKTHSCFRLLTNALTGAMLFTTTALQGVDQGKVTVLMTKDLVNVPGKELHIQNPYDKLANASKIGSVEIEVAPEKPVLFYP